MLAATVGDQLKLRHGRVIAVSNKDRAAILMGGRLADAAYWMDGGRFVTSRYYRNAVPEWVERFNAERRVEADFGREWKQLLPPEVYDRVQGPDDASGEESRLGLGTTFPRRVDGGSSSIVSTFYDAHRLTPFSSALLVDFALAALRAEQLGRHEGPDLLCIGFSQLDHAGHSYGPDSHEIMDAFLRLDREMARLFSALDDELGTGAFLVVLTADHGVTPLPERALASGRGEAAGRFDGAALDARVELALTTRFGPPADGEPWTARDSYGYRLRPAARATRRAPLGEVCDVIKQAVLGSPQIAVAWIKDEVMHASTEGYGLETRLRLSFHDERSQDVVFVLKPGIVDRAPAGTNHGGPYDCDDHVPLVWFGPGVRPGIHHERVDMEDLAPTLAAWLGVPRPPRAKGRVLFGP